MKIDCPNCQQTNVFTVEELPTKDGERMPVECVSCHRKFIILGEILLKFTAEPQCQECLKLEWECTCAKLYKK